MKKGLVLFWVGVASVTAYAGGPAPPDFRALLADIGERYEVEITWGDGPYRYDTDWGWVRADSAGDWEVEMFAPVVADELSLYPPEFFKDAEIEGVILARDVWVEQEGVARNVAGYIFDSRIVASVSYTYKVNHRNKQRRYLHHLVWHQIDGLSGTLWEDPEWVALNPEGFEYGLHSKGGVHDRSSESGLLSTEYPGFINRYGTGNVPDDKADLFAYLMVAHHWVEERAAEDPFLRAKVRMIKNRLAGFDSAFDDEFWEKIDAIRRDVSPYFRP